MLTVMGDALPENLQRYSWSNEPEYGVLDRETCDCKHPYATRDISRDGAPWGAYRVEAGASPELMYALVLFDQPTPDNPDPQGLVRFWIRFRPPSVDAFGFMMDSAQVSDTDGNVAQLDRDEALAHPRIGEAWELIDWLFVTDPMIHQVMGHGRYPTPENWPGLVLGDDHAPRPSVWQRLLGRRS